MWRNKFWEWFDNYSGLVFGPILVGLAWVFGRYVEPRWPNTFTNELPVALMIAGILAFTIDPFVKNRARREATRDIFHHMLGFTLPLQIRERLQEIVETTKFYRENTAMRYSLRESNELMIFDVEMEFELVNPTQHSLSFEPHVEFEINEVPVFKTVVCFEETSYGKNPQLKPNPKVPNLLEYRGEPIMIPSESRRSFKYEYCVSYPKTLGFLFLNFQYPTIALHLTVKTPENFKVTASPADSESLGEWRYGKRLFMPGNHLDIRWEPG